MVPSESVEELSDSPEAPEACVGQSKRTAAGTGIRSEGNLYRGSAQGVSVASSGSVAVAGKPASGGLSLQGNVSESGSGGAFSGGQASACAGE